jgi:uncharacterized membrane protein
MATVKDSIEVNVSAALAHAYWSRFEEFPKFMEEVQEIKRYSPDTIHWKAKIAGKEEEWDAKVTENIPSRRIVWKSTSGLKNNGAVMFEPISPTTTRVELEMEYEPKGVTEKVGEMLGIDKNRVHKNLESFKRYAESQTI